jgi:protease-4
MQTDPLTQKWQDFRAELTSLQTLNDPKGIYARLPFNWKWH